MPGVGISGVEDIVSVGKALGSTPSSASPTGKRKRKFNFNLQLITPEGSQMICCQIIDMICIEGAKITRNSIGSWSWRVGSVVKSLH